MVSSSERVSTFLRSSGCLDSTAFTEACVVLLPTKRLKAGQLLTILSENDIPVRKLAHGVARIRDKYLIVRKVSGIIVLAVPTDYLHKLDRIIRLSGASVVKVQEVTAMAR